MILVSYCVHVPIILFTWRFSWLFVYIFYQYVLEVDSGDSQIYHHFQVLWLSYLKVNMFLKNNKLMVIPPTKMVNVNDIGKLLCTHPLYYLMYVPFCKIISISFLLIFFKMESVDWSILYNNSQDIFKQVWWYISLYR